MVAREREGEREVVVRSPLGCPLFLHVMNFVILRKSVSGFSTAVRGGRGGQCFEQDSFYI